MIRDEVRITESGDLAVFLAVAEAEPIGRAAERLHTVQSAVTTRIRKLEGGTFDAILACVSAGMGLTLLPEAMLEQWASRHAVSLLTLPDREGVAETVLIRRKQSYVSSAMRAFLEALDDSNVQRCPIAAE